MVDLKWLEKALQSRKDAGSLRSLQDTSNLIDFSSNHYLGLNFEPRFRSESFPNQLRKGSRLLNGHTNRISEIETAIAETHGVEAAIILNSGYQANLALFSGLLQRTDTVLYDELSHASIRDGLTLSRCRHYAFHHNNLEHLKNRLGQAEGRTFVSTESIFSMDGDGPDLEAMLGLCEDSGAFLIVDEAHAFGVCGTKGLGRSETFTSPNLLARVVTYGKAVGCDGAAILGSQTLVDYLVNFARPFIYTTAPAPSFYEHIHWAYGQLKDESSRKKELSNNIDCFKQACARYNVQVIGGMAAVFAVLIPGNVEVRSAQTHMAKKGYDVRPVLSPTVTKGLERLRICMHAYNTEAEIEGLVLTLSKWLNHH